MALSDLNEREQKMAMMAASGYSHKEIAAETGISYQHARQILAPNDKDKKQPLIDAVAEIKLGFANGLKALPDLIVTRLRTEILDGASDTTHHYIKLATSLVKELDVSSGNLAKGLPGINALIQNFVTEKPVRQKSPPLDVVVEAVEAAHN